MEINKAYNIWAKRYDKDENKTRDLEAKVLQKTLGSYRFKHILEIGCGTGKNTQWLHTICDKLTAVDFSSEMQKIAKEKLKDAKNIEFVVADITKDWSFATERYDLITFSLVLEHIEDLKSVFCKAVDVLSVKGEIYVAELHPFRQYAGSKARYETESGTAYIHSYTHHISDFYKAAKESGLSLELVEEYFDEADRTKLPRLVMMVFRSAPATEEQ